MHNVSALPVFASFCAADDHRAALYRAGIRAAVELTSRGWTVRITDTGIRLAA